MLTASAYTSLCDVTLHNNESLRANASTPLRMQHTASGAPGDTLALSDFRAQAWKLWSADGAFNVLKARLHMLEQSCARASKAAFPLARPRTRQQRGAHSLAMLRPREQGCIAASQPTHALAKAAPPLAKAALELARLHTR